MCGVCGVLAGRDLMSGVDDDEGCILPRNHQGPHEFVAADGSHWLWETDLECECEHCMECEGDYCILYWRKPIAAATASHAANLHPHEVDPRQIALF